MDLYCVMFFSHGLHYTNHITTPWTIFILAPTTKQKPVGTPCYFQTTTKIHLTQLSYKVNSFLDFQPFLKGFQSVCQYLEDLMKDLNSPGYFQRLLYLVKSFQITPLSNESTIQEFFNLVTC